MAALKQIKDIKVFAEIYEGATTLVYKGYQESLQRFVLLKVLRPEFKLHEDLVRRFENEAKVIAKVHHPNLVAIHDYGEYEQWLYFATEFVDGCDLGDLVLKAKLPPECAWFALLETVKGLKAAHSKNILHRDIKPSNILISHSGQVKLTDFGTAVLRMSSNEEIIEDIGGTLAYFSPEQILGQEQNEYSDIFSLGATFYEVLSGIQPFYGKSTNDLFSAILNNEPIQFLKKNKQIPAPLIRICQKMLMKNPADRYQNCDELIQDLNNFQLQYEVTASSDQLMAFMKDPVSYHPKLLKRKIKKEETTLQLNKNQRIKKFNYGYSLYFFVPIALVLLVGYYALSNKRDNSLQDSALANLKVDSIQPRSSMSEAKPITLKSASKPQPVDKLSKDDLLNEISNDKKSDTLSTVLSGLVLIQSEEPLEESEQVNHIATGYLQISCAPWADVYIDGDSIGRTPLKDSITLTTGSHNIVLRNPDFPEYKALTEIRDGGLTDFEFSFWSLVGTLRLEVSPWADVYIDGEKRVTTPQRRPLLLLPGKHVLTLKHPALGEWQTSIEVAAGISLELRYNLKELLSK